MRSIQYIYELAGWPGFTWSNREADLLALLGKTRHLQGNLTGRMETLGFALRQEANLENLTADVLQSTAIEGEFLHPQQVRSSIARRLGMDIAGLVPSDRNTDGIVEMTLDATQQQDQLLSAERLFGWHSALFLIGSWRTDTTGPMQVVSGAIGLERVHFQAPDAHVIATEMDVFIHWFNTANTIDPVLKAGIAHLWFLTIHPFDDGNGRIARALTDMLLSRADGTAQRFYSMSAQIQLQRKQYYEILEQTQKGSLDISAWLIWFLTCLSDALTNTADRLEKVLQKAVFLERYQNVSINDRQRLMLNKIMDDFEGNLTASKWAKITKCSEDTALRDIQDLIQKKMLVKAAAGGRSTYYVRG